MLGLVILSIGVLIGLVFYGFAVWAGLEASLFAPPGDGSGPLGTLTCPVMITTRETGVIQATFSNSTDSPFRAVVKATITEGAVILTRQVGDAFRLQPGEMQLRQWEVTAKDAAWNRFVFFRLSVFQYPVPSKTASCGVLVVDLPAFTGAQVTAFLTVVSITLMVIGLALWSANNRPLTGRKMNITLALGAWCWLQSC